jgi:hypothetical protein
MDQASVVLVLTPGVPCLVPVLVLRFDDRPEQGIGGVVLRSICCHGFSVPPWRSSSSASATSIDGSGLPRSRAARRRSATNRSWESMTSMSRMRGA